MTSTTGDQMPPEWHNFKAPLITGVRGGHTIDLRQIASEGATLLGSLLDVSDGRLRIAGDLDANLKVGMTRLCGSFEQSMTSSKGRELVCQPRTASTHIYAKRQKALAEVDLRDAKISTVIWAIGYRYDFGWIDFSVFDNGGCQSSGVE